MRYIPLADIKVPADRQRQFFDPDRLAELQDSILRIGLIQPLVVTEDNTLVAGERRLKCLRNLDMLGDQPIFDGIPITDGLVPCIYPSESTPETLFEIELEENIRRHDLSWQEQAEAVRRLAQLRTGQARDLDIKPPTTADIAEEVTGRRDGAYQEQTRRQLIVAGHLNDTDVLKAKSVDEAFKILRKKETVSRNLATAQAVGQVAVNERHMLFNDDCLQWGWDWVEKGEPKFDLIVSDPPYGMGAQDFGDAGGSYAGIIHEYNDSFPKWLSMMNLFAQLSVAITKPQAHLYLFCDIDGFPHLKRIFKEAGWMVHRTPLVMHKRDANRVSWPQHGPRRSYELVLYAIRGDRPVNAIYSDVFESVGDDNLGHGAQKPVSAWADLLRRSAKPGDRILDPFAGTGGLMVAAHEAGCNSVLVEQEPAYFGIMLNRLEALKCQK